jgi:hypothetical protein
VLAALLEIGNRSPPQADDLSETFLSQPDTRASSANALADGTVEVVFREVQRRRQYRQSQGRLSTALTVNKVDFYNRANS